MMKSKKIKISSLLMVMLILSMAFVAVVSAKEKDTTDSSKMDKLTSAEKKLIDEYDFTLEDIQYYEDLGFDAKTILKTESKVKYSKSLPQIIQNAPYRPMITADTDSQKAILKHIDNFSVSKTEKEEMKKSLIDIWSRVPNKITEDDYTALTKIGVTLDAYLGETYWDEDGTEDVNIKWSGTGSKNVHGDFIYYGVMGVYNNANWANTAKACANDPDNGTLDSGAMRYYNHYYHPTVPITGGAPGRCLYFSQYAKNNYANNKNVAFYDLGLASHYLSDVGNPMHTDGPAGQTIQYILSNDLHAAYEKYVSTNWSSGYNYKSIVTSNTASKTVTSPSSAAQSLAAFSNPYYDTLWDELMSNPTGFGSDVDVRYATSKVIRETAKYNRGLAAYIST
ncbi:MAG: hypothetical protein PWQ63_1449 [Methanolobus sp.]|nr:hypothetical protein [Methanolobus sp.]